jgi:hypothetical protein
MYQVLYKNNTCPTCKAPALPAPSLIDAAKTTLSVNDRESYKKFMAASHAAQDTLARMQDISIGMLFNIIKRTPY